MDNALASVRMEGLEPSDEAKAIFQRHVEGELTEVEMRAAVSDLYDRKYGPVQLMTQGKRDGETGRTALLS